MFEQLLAHARESSPAECCGFVGERGGVGRSVYPMRNVAAQPLVRYEIAVEDLMAAPKLMRARDEQLLGIYHSHPLEARPMPSDTDVRLAYYPEAIYFIIGFDADGRGVLRAFRIYEREGRWEDAPFQVIED